MLTLPTTGSAARFRALADASLLDLYRHWEDLSPRDNEALLDEMARRGMTGLEDLVPVQATPCAAVG